MQNICLSRFLINQQWHKQAIRSDLRLLVEVVARAIKAMGINFGKGALGACSARPAPATCRARRVIANGILLEASNRGGHLAAMASEEMEGPHPIPHRYLKGETCCSTRSTAPPTST